MKSNSSRFPTILEKKVLENKVILTCLIHTDLVFLDGHFPNNPILPGIAQMHWAVHYAKEFFNILGPVAIGKNIKFTNVILPETTLNLILEHMPENYMFSYSYVLDDKSFSSGRLNYASS